MTETSTSRLSGLRRWFSEPFKFKHHDALPNTSPLLRLRLHPLPSLGGDLPELHAIQRIQAPDLDRALQLQSAFQRPGPEHLPRQQHHLGPGVPRGVQLPRADACRVNRHHGAEAELLLQDRPLHLRPAADRRCQLPLPRPVQPGDRPSRRPLQGPWPQGAQHHRLPRQPEHHCSTRSSVRASGSTPRSRCSSSSPPSRA